MAGKQTQLPSNTPGSAPRPHLCVHQVDVLARLQHRAAALLPLHSLLQQLGNGGQPRRLAHLQGNKRVKCAAVSAGATGPAITA